jgi:hypothetical protein
MLQVGSPARAAMEVASAIASLAERRVTQPV